MFRVLGRELYPNDDIDKVIIVNSKKRKEKRSFMLSCYL